MSVVRSWLASPRPLEPAVVTEPAARRRMRAEIGLVLTVTLGLSGVRSLLSLLDSLSQPQPLAAQKVTLNAPAARLGVLDLVAQLASAAQLLAWGGLAGYLLVVSGITLRAVGIDRDRPGRDLAAGAGLAALIGVPGLGLYLVARAVGANLTVLPSTLTDTWWRLPVLVISAVGNAWAEEVIVVGYLLTRLRQLGAGEGRALAGSAVLRGSYHLYQGFGGFAGNLVMGLVFGRIWQRTNRLWPLVAAHSIIDIVAFGGYALLHGHVGWLP